MIYLNRSVTSGDVIRRLSFLFDVYSMPECIKSDYGQEFVAHRVHR